MRRTLNILLLLATTALLLWPALVNGYPLLYPDTLDYLGTGRPALLAFLHGHTGFHSVRSAVYAAGIYIFHWNRTPWPILAFNAAAVAWPVYLTVRSFFPRAALRRTLFILATLSVVTGLSWFTSFLLPDILGAPLYLALFLLAFARHKLSRAEQTGLAALAVFCAAAHASHLLLAMLLCGFLWFLALVLRSIARPSPRSLFVMTAVVASAVALTLAVNQRLCGRPSLTGDPPPFLMARILADGPGKLYLRDRCGQDANSFRAMCRHLDNLPAAEDEFLWSPTGIWPLASPAEQLALQKEQMPLVLGTLRHYPRQQIAASFANFREQLTSFELNDFENNEYMQTDLNAELPNARAIYDRSLQARNAMPCAAFTWVQNIAVLLSLAVVALSPPGIVRLPTALRARWLAFGATAVFVVVVNAAIGGVLSAVDFRYQARIIWLLPLLASLLAARYFDARRRPQT